MTTGSKTQRPFPAASRTAERSEIRTDPTLYGRVYGFGWRLGYVVGTFWNRMSLVPAPSLRDTVPLTPGSAASVRVVAVRPRELAPSQAGAPRRRRPALPAERQRLQRVWIVATSLPATKRLLVRLLGSGVAAEFALLTASMLVLCWTGTPSLDDVLRLLSSAALVALELLLSAVLGAFLAEILLSVFAVVQAALTE